MAKPENYDPFLMVILAKQIKVKYTTTVLTESVGKKKKKTDVEENICRRWDQCLYKIGPVSKDIQKQPIW